MKTRKKIELTAANSVTLGECFQEMYNLEKAQGHSFFTLQTLVGKQTKLYSYFPEGEETVISELRQSDITNLMQWLWKKNIKPTSVNSYACHFRKFFNFATRCGYCHLSVEVPRVQQEAKQTYTDEEMRLLLEKPNLRKCSFVEYRNWMVINLLLNCGARAGTLREIKVEDVDLENRCIYCRHTKNKKALMLPLTTVMVQELASYMKVLKKYKAVWLFPNNYGEQLSQNTLAVAIKDYNRSRGVSKTSIHLFRHTFARQYVQAGGNPFMLQKILGHSTIAMTMHYVNLYEQDAIKDIDDFAPLMRLTQHKKGMKVR